MSDILEQFDLDFSTDLDFGFTAVSSAEVEESKKHGEKLVDIGDKQVGLDVKLNTLEEKLNQVLAVAERKYEDRQEMKDTWTDAQKLVSTKEVRDLSKGKDVSQTKVFDLYIRGDVAGIEALGVKLTDDDKKKLEKRGNVMENFSPKSGPLSSKYESLEGTISRMKR